MNIDDDESLGSKSPYSDGSPDDEEHWEIVRADRRANMSDERAIEKVLKYLEQYIQVLQMDERRHREAKDAERERVARERIQWTEAMILWMNHNC